MKKEGKLIGLFLFPIIVAIWLVSPCFETKAYANLLLRPTDLSQPEFLDMYSFTRLIGKEEAVYFSIPANQISSLIPIVSNPSPFILAKYEREKAKGNIFIMRIWQTGEWIRGEILRITPRNFHHYFTPHLYNFAFLVAKNSNCQLLGDVSSSGTDRIREIEKAFAEYDHRVMELVNQGYDVNVARNSVYNPTVSARILVGNPNIYNRSDFYWYQRINDNESCWEKASTGDYDRGDGEFHDISEVAFYNMVALAMELHKAGAGLIIFPKVRQDIKKSVSKSAFRKKVKITVKYFVYPEYLMVFPKKTSESYGEFYVNPGNSIRSTSYGFIKVTGNHNFPVDEILVYKWSKTKKGWTGFAVFLGSLLLGALTGGLLSYTGVLSLGSLNAIAAGSAVGAIGGLIASGFSPTTSVTAQFTPFVYSRYQFDPSTAWSGDSRKVADRTFAQWLRPDVQSTPGGVGVFVSRIDMRKAVLCGGASRTNMCDPSVSNAVVQVHADDPNFWNVFNEMFQHSSQYLMQYKYPFTIK